MKSRILLLVAVSLLCAVSAFASDKPAAHETWTGKIIAGAHGPSDLWFEAAGTKYELTGQHEAAAAPYANHEVKLTGTMNATKTSIEVASVAPMTADAHGVKAHTETH